MPDFVLDTGDQRATRRFVKLDAFTKGYITAAFWLIDEEIKGAHFGRLAVSALREAKADCLDFQRENASMLALAYAGDEYDAHRAGVDFWLTRNGHGAGYWDRGELTKIKVGVRNETNVGDALADRASVYGSVDLYRGDNGKLYFT